MKRQKRGKKQIEGLTWICDRLKHRRRNHKYKVSLEDPAALRFSDGVFFVFKNRRSVCGGGGHSFKWQTCCMLGSFDCQLWSWITISCEGIKCEEVGGGNNPPPPPRSVKGLNKCDAAQASVASGCSINKTHGSGKTISSVHACGRCHTHTCTHTLTVYTVKGGSDAYDTHTHTHTHTRL